MLLDEVLRVCAQYPLSPRDLGTETVPRRVEFAEAETQPREAVASYLQGSLKIMGA